MFPNLHFVTFLLVASASLLPATLATGTCRKKKTTTTAHTANFDDLPALDDPRSQVTTPYNSLAFPNFYIETYVTQNFLIPASGDQYTISYDTRISSITALYPGSTVKSFALESLYYACIQGVPQDECVITITGYKSRGVVTKTVVYPALVPPVDPSTVTMRMATFGSEWSELQTVSFSISLGGYGGLVLDSLNYTTEDCKKH
ncbi:hypothetical protein MMC24_005506 [Lignoscripta atroalba]|nr:hypothetical protein [Lignoscripta atroalba]